MRKNLAAVGIEDR